MVSAMLAEDHQFLQMETNNDNELQLQVLMVDNKPDINVEKQ